MASVCPRVHYAPPETSGTAQGLGGESFKIDAMKPIIALEHQWKRPRLILHWKGICWAVQCIVDYGFMHRANDPQKQSLIISILISVSEIHLVMQILLFLRPNLIFSFFTALLQAQPQGGNVVLCQSLPSASIQHESSQRLLCYFLLCMFFEKKVHSGRFFLLSIRVVLKKTHK